MTIPIDDTFAEAFGMTATRLIVTACNSAWAKLAGTVATGYACSVIGCDAEAGIERQLCPEETPDGRPGVALLFFAFSRDALQKAVVNRVSQCILTCATTACYSGLTSEPEREIRLGGLLRYFGDGWQISKLHDRRRLWRIPTMDGEFLCEDKFGTIKGIAGGNILILAKSQQAGLEAAERACQKVHEMPEVILPFPGGIVRSGSKVGSRYKALKASTNHAFCPSLKSVTASELPDEVNAVYEIVVDGLTEQAIAQALRAMILEVSSAPGVVKISAGNYGGKLGKHHFSLKQLLETPP